MDENDMYISLFACCLIVNGASRATVVDIQREDYIFIPLEIAKILLNEEKLNIKDLLSPYSESDQQEITNFFDYLITSEYAFYTREPELFPQIDLNWKVHNTITNSILDFDTSSDIDITDIVLQLENLGCETIEIRCFNALPLSNINYMLNIIENGLGIIRNIQLLICYDPNISQSLLEALIDKFPRLTSITMHTTPLNESHQYGGGSKRINYTKQSVTDESHCGFISPGYFTINKPMFLESQNFNTCLNRKIAIDSRGNIKNCPAMEQSFGHFKKIKLSDVVESSNFISKWSINKDNIEICKDCEFRYMCTDCRAFQNQNDSLHYKPVKCSYDPYSMTWSEETFKA